MGKLTFYQYRSADDLTHIVFYFILLYFCFDFRLKNSSYLNEHKQYNSVDFNLSHWKILSAFSHIVDSKGRKDKNKDIPYDFE